MKTVAYTKDKNGLDKMRDLLNETKVFMMATNLGKIPFSVCPMTLQEMDEQGNLWFFTPRDSDHFRDIERDNRVQLISSNRNKRYYLSIFGNATNIVDNKKIEQLWNPALFSWFSGMDDSNMALININMEMAHYWDGRQNVALSLLGFNEPIEVEKGVMGTKGIVNLQNH